MQKLIIVFFLMFGMALMHSDYMYIELTSGTVPGFSLIEIEQITFSENQLSVHLVQGYTDSFSIEDIVQITFSEYVSIEDMVKFISKIPIEFLKNHPNPFNPTTTISFTTSVSGFTEVIVYNSRGRRVRSLLSEEIDAGSHTLLWDGKNEQNRPVSSGVYIYKVSVDGLQKTSKMLLLK